MKNEIDRKQTILEKVSKVCRRIEVFVVCLFGVLIFLDIFDVRIDFGNSRSLKLTVFILITGLFIVTDTVMVYLQTLNDSLSKKRLAWNIAIVWAVNAFVLTCTHNYVFGSSFSHIYPKADSAAFIIGGTQFMFYSLHMSYRRKQIKNNDR